MDDQSQSQPNVVQNQQQLPQDQSQQVPAAPVSVGGAMGEPSATPRKEAGQVLQVHEFVTPSEKEPDLSKEVEAAGVTVEPNAPVLTTEHAKIGIQLAGEATPVAISQGATVSLRMTQAQAQKTLKLHKKVSKSVVWLASIILRQFKELQYKNQK